jgi:FkbM family methyltransferase
MKLTDKQLDEMANLFGFKALRERYRVFEEYFDIQEGDVVVDGGSFTGDGCLYFSKKVGNNGKVYAFEPLEMNYKRLIRFLRYQMLNNVHPYKIALWNKNETIPFYLSKYPNAGSLLDKFRKVTEQYEYVQANALDNVIDEVSHIWLNIEGAEVKAIQGAEDLLMENDVNIMVSCHKINDEYNTKDDVIKLLNEYGYRTELVKNHLGWVYGKRD